MRIAPLKWTYECNVMDAPEWASRPKWIHYTIFVKDCEWNATKSISTQFTLSDVSEEFVKRIVEKLNDAMETQRHEFLWGLASKHSIGELYGGDDE